MPSLKFDAVIETAKVVSGFRDIQNAVHQTAATVESEGKSIDNIINKIKSSASIAIGGWSIAGFVNQMMQVRGQFQQTEMAFKTMLQSEEKAKDLMQQMIHTAAITPFGVEDVTEGAKQLLAFNIAAEDVNDTLIKLGDVAAGMGLSLSDLVMLYGTTIAKGKMDTMDLYQFLNRGIPIADEIAKVMGLDVSNAIAEVKKQLTAGKVTSDIFKEAMQNMAAEGGKFGGLMEAQSKTIVGQISNIKDAIEQMFNELGRSQEGIINTGLDVVSTLVENWQKVGQVVMVAATAYGTYKAVLMTATALQTLNNRILQQAIVEKTLAAAAGINLSNAEAVAAARTKFLTLAQKGLAVALKETAAATLSNPYVLLAAAITAVTYAVYKLATAETAHEEAVRKSNEAWDEFDNKVKERQQNIENLIRTIQSETATEYQKAEAYQKLASLAPQLTEEYDQATLASIDFAKVQKETAEAIDNLKYEKAIEDVEKYRNTIESINQQIEQDAKYNGSKGSSFLLGQLDRAQEALNQAEDKLANIVQLRDQSAENAKPIEIRLQEAQENESVRQEIFDFYDKAMTLANDWQAANETINFATGESRLDAFINEAEKELEGLRDKIKKNPADVNLRLKEEEKTKVLNNLLSMKRNWAVTGATSIPLIFKAQWNTAKQSLNQAKTKAQALANAGSTETYVQAKKNAKSEYIKALQAEKDAKKGSNAAWEKAKENLEAKKKIYDKYWESTSRANKKASTDAKKNADRQRKAQEELNNRLKALQQKNTDETISLMQEGTEKKLAEIKNDYAKRKAEIDKQEAEFKKKNKEAGKKEALTSAQSEALTKARDLATQEYNKKLDEVNMEALTSMRDYLKEYGSLYQQKQAIAEEYEEKIAKAQTEGEKLSLKQQKKKELQNIEIDAIKQNIDWGSVFSDFGAMFKDQLEPTIKKLQELSKSTTDVNEQKTIQELISKLQGSATVWDSDIFKKVSDDINAYQSAMQGYIDAQEREIEATKAVTKAQEDLAKAKKGGNKNSISEAKGNLSRAQNVLATASNNVLKFGSSVQKTSSDLQTSAQKAVSQFQQLEDGLQGLTSGSLKSIGNSILGLDKLFGGTMQKDVANMLAKGIQGLLGKDSNAAKILSEALGDSGMAGEIISAVLSILDILKGGFGTLITDLTETVFDAITGILDDALSGDIVMKPLKSVGDNVSHILNTLSFGGFNSLFGGDGNAKKVNDTIERLTDRNTLLQQSIEDLTDAMENAYGSKATSYYDQAYKNQQETNQNYLDIAKAQASYHASHGSWNHYWSGFSSDEMDWIKKNVKSDFNGDLFSLSPEEMKLLRGNVAIWEHIEGTGKGNYGGRLTEKLNDYIDQAGKLDELSDKLKESLTQISFDSMKDSFVSDLMDMSKSAQDFADDFAEMMQKALLSYSMEDLINGDLKKLYDDWAKAIKDNDGKLSETDIEAFNKRYDDIVQEGLKRRDDWAKVTGYTGSSSSSQTATSGGWASMGQDTADELNGRFTALQIAGESIAQNMTTTISQMESIVTLGISTNGAVLEIRNMMIMTNSYLEDIVKYSKLTYNDFGTKLDDMNRRLKDI